MGKGGRRILAAHLSEAQQRHQIDFTIVNVENAAGGFGVTPKLAREILALGVDVMTTGNHVWDKKEILDYMPREPRLLRPANYPPDSPGHWLCVGETPAGTPVAVLNLQGRVFMPLIDCPFQTVDRELPKIVQKSRIVVVDFHAEATSEKVAMGWHLDGRVAAVVGTHTHIPTADERILPEGTAYISDVGMTGSYESVIGMKTEGALSRFLTGRSFRLEAEARSPRFSAVVLDVDESTGRARSINRLSLC